MFSLKVKRESKLKSNLWQQFCNKISNFQNNIAVIISIITKTKFIQEHTISFGYPSLQSNQHNAAMFYKLEAAYADVFRKLR